MKKILFVIFLSLFLISCSRLTGNSSTTENFSGDNFSMQIPSNWNDITKSNRIPNPAEGELVLAIQSPNQLDNFYNNLTILKVSGDYSGENSEYWSNVNHNFHKSNYPLYESKGEKSITFSDGDVSNLYTFNADYNSDEKAELILQTVKKCSDSEAFYLTIGTSLDIVSAANYTPIFESFSCNATTK